MAIMATAIRISFFMVIIFNGNVDANIGLLGLLLTKYTIFYDLKHLLGVGNVVDS